jgi:hypothetical protein
MIAIRMRCSLAYQPIRSRRPAPDTGRERQVVEDHVIRPRERLAEKVAVDLMAGDVPSGEYLLLGLTDIKQLHYRHGYTPIRVRPWILNIDVQVVI